MSLDRYIIPLAIVAWVGLTAVIWAAWWAVEQAIILVWSVLA